MTAASPASHSPPPAAAPADPFAGFRAAFARLPAWAPFAFVFLATLLAYAPVFRAAYVWNDADYVTRPELRSLSGLWRIWFDVGSTEQHYPLLHGAFWLENRLWGQAPLGYHLFNVLLHAASACLFALILRRLLATSPTASLTSRKIENRESKIQNPLPWLAALLFALHPVAVESVAWVSEQKNTLSTFFALAAALAYLRYDDDRHAAPAHPPPAAPDRAAAPVRFYRLATVLFVVALLVKSLTATLPPALLVLAWWRHGRLGWRRDVVPLLPWFVVGALTGLFSGWVEHTFVGASGVEFDLTPLQRVLVIGRSAWFYLAHTFWPAGLVFIYPRWVVDPTDLAQWLFPAAALAFTGVLWALRHRTRAPLAAWLLFVGTLFPVSGAFSLYAFRYSFVADHWQYLPLLPVIAFAVAAGARAAGRLPARLAPLALAAVAALLVSFAALSWRQTLQFRDIVTFYRTIIRDNPTCWMAHSNLGDFYFRASLSHAATLRYLDEARVPPAIRTELLGRDLLAASLDEYRATLRLNPTHVEGHNSLAVACLQAGLAEEALTHFQRAIELRPDYPDALCNLGYLLTNFGRPAEAVEHLRHALRLRPRYAEAHNHLGAALLALGRPEQSVRAHREALRLNPALTAARNNLGNALVAAGRPVEAVAEFERALRDKPDDIELRLNLGNALDHADRLPEAIAQYEAALRTRPDFVEAHNNLGFALLRQSRFDDAIAHFRRALELRPDFQQARNNLDLAERLRAQR